MVARPVSDHWRAEVSVWSFIFLRGVNACATFAFDFGGVARMVAIKLASEAAEGALDFVHAREAERAGECRRIGRFRLKSHQPQFRRARQNE